MSDVSASLERSPETIETAALPERSQASVRIYVCVTCNDRRSGIGQQAGRRFCADLAAEVQDPRIEVVPIPCLSVCRPLCALSFAAAGKWTHVFAVPSHTEVAEVLEGARLYAESRSGLFSWGGNEALRQGVVARVPPTSGR